MSRLVLGIGLVAGVFLAVAVAVLWRWESTARSVTLGDVVVSLGLLPLAIVGVLFGLGWAWRGATPRHEAALAEAAARRGPVAAPPDTATLDEQVRHARFRLLAAHGLSAAGSTPADILAAAVEGKPRPALAHALRDGDGLAVLSARIADLSTATVEQALAPVVDGLQRQRPAWAGLEPGDHVVRALAALVEPLKGALHDLQPWADALGAAPASDGSVAGAAATPAGAALLRLVLGWPPEWSEFEREAATGWARRHVAEHTDWPATRCAVASHAVSGPELWLQAEQVLQTLAREGRHDRVLVAATHSDLSAVAVTRLDESQRLFSAARRPRGLVPGEAAAALLLAPEAGAPAPGAALPSGLLHRAAVLRRDQSVEAAGRVSSQTLQAAATQALSAARIGHEAVGAVVCDADQHSSRGPEFFGAVLDLLPQLDAAVDVALLGTTAGHIGAVDALLVIAVAAERARNDDKPCLALALGDPFMRLALLARPPPPEQAAA